ncbi:MAG TPA: hypothetical protein VGE77_01395 [Nocardioides sp.]
MKRTQQLLGALVSVLLALGAATALTPAAHAEENGSEPPAPVVLALDHDATTSLATGGTVTPITSPPAGAGLDAPGLTPSWSEQRKWYGKQYRFTKRETNNIAAGGTACAAILGKIPAIKVLCTAASVSAGLARANGKCLAYNVYYGGSSNPWYWNC